MGSSGSPWAAFFAANALHFGGRSAWLKIYKLALFFEIFLPRFERKSGSQHAAESQLLPAVLADFVFVGCGVGGGPTPFGRILRAFWDIVSASSVYVHMAWSVDQARVIATRIEDRVALVRHVEALGVDLAILPTQESHRRGTRLLLCPYQPRTVCVAHVAAACVFNSLINTCL